VSAAHHVFERNVNDQSAGIDNGDDPMALGDRDQRQL
jgi:hypothetical protein